MRHYHSSFLHLLVFVLFCYTPVSAIAKSTLPAKTEHHTYDNLRALSRTYVNEHAKQTSVAMYIDEWRQKIEKIGSLMYPVDSSGKKIYGEVRVMAEIHANGRLMKVSIDKTSGNSLIDDAALRIVKMSSPFKALPVDMVDATGQLSEVLVITKKFTFERQRIELNDSVASATALEQL